MNMQRIIWYWAPALMWMLAIFLLSSRHRVEVSNVYAINFLVFKFFHLVEYATLYFLIYRALQGSHIMTKRKQVVLAFVITISYALSDEIHQAFVPTREGHIRDVLIDAAGAWIMYIYIQRRIQLGKMNII